VAGLVGLVVAVPTTYILWVLLGYGDAPYFAVSLSLGLGAGLLVAGLLVGATGPREWLFVAIAELGAALVAVVLVLVVFFSTTPCYPLCD